MDIDANKIGAGAQDRPRSAGSQLGQPLQTCLDRSLSETEFAVPDMAMGQNTNRTTSEHPNSTAKMCLQWVVNFTALLRPTNPKASGGDGQRAELAGHLRVIGPR